jgi:cytidine deaminase
MKEINITASFKVYQQLEDLDVKVRNLMYKAIEARHKAYAPYSKFKVGAALLLENNEVITGNNQENACYPSGLCAERVAIYSAGANRPGVPVKILAITASSEKYTLKNPVPPCGACRQSLVEYEINQKEPIEVYFMGAEGTIVRSDSVKNLLPLTFDSSFL